MKAVLMLLMLMPIAGSLASCSKQCPADVADHCGAGQTCPASLPQCCANGTCVAEGAACPAAVTSPGRGAVYGCDDLSDCPSGEVCCSSFSKGSGSSSTYCSKTCDGYVGYQVCRESCECLEGECVNRACR